MNRKILILLLFLFAVPVSCKDSTTGMPKNQVMPRETFIRVLVDMHMLDAITNSHGYYNKYNPGDSLDLYSHIFDKYGVNRTRFDSTVAAYSRLPEKYLSVYDEVILRLNVGLDSIRASIDKNPAEAIH